MHRVLGTGDGAHRMSCNRYLLTSLRVVGARLVHCMSPHVLRGLSIISALFAPRYALRGRVDETWRPLFFIFTVLKIGVETCFFFW
jgi:hypothetical protein